MEENRRTSIDKTKTPLPDPIVNAVFFIDENILQEAHVRWLYVDSGIKAIRTFIMK
jgi:hypothetical protein